MKLLTFKVSEALLKEMDRATVDFHFANRTEFIRAAIREKIERHRMLHHLSTKLEGSIRRMEYTG